MRDVKFYSRIKYVTVPVVALIFLQVGRPLPLWDYLNTNNFYFDLIFAILIASIIWSYIQYCFSTLDDKVSWEKAFVKRFWLQVLFSFIIPIALLFILYVSYMQLYYGENFNIKRSIIYEVDMPLGGLLILLMNMFLGIVDLTKRKGHRKHDILSAENSNTEAMLQMDKEQKTLLVANGSKYTVLNTEEIQYIKLQRGVSVACTREESTTVLNIPLNSLEDSLPGYFYRVNRNTIVNLKEVRGFIAEKSGRLILKLNTEDHEEITVSQHRSTDFRNKLISI